MGDGGLKVLKGIILHAELKTPQTYNPKAPIPNPSPGTLQLTTPKPESEIKIQLTIKIPE